MRSIWTRSLRHRPAKTARRLGNHLERLEARDVPAAFSPGNLVVYRAGDGTQTLSANGNTIFLDEYTTAGAFVQSIVLPSNSAGTNLVGAGNATSEGNIALSPSGQYLAVAGYNQSLPNTVGLAASTPATINRSVAIVDSTGNFTLTKLSDPTGNPRGAVAVDGGNAFYLASSGSGIRYATVDTANTVTSTGLATTGVTQNLRATAIYGDQLYVSTSSSTTFRIGAVGTGQPTTSGQVITNPPGLPVTIQPYQFFFADLSPTEPGLDTLYVADNAAGLEKFTVTGGTWALNNTITVSGISGVIGHVQGSCVSLYYTNGPSIFALTDMSGYGNPMNGSPVSLKSAVANTAYRGIAFAPQTTPPAEASNITTPTTTTSAGPVNYTVVFNHAVVGLTAANFTLTTTDTAAGTIAPPTTIDGITWTVPIIAISGNGTLRLDLTNGTGVTPPLYFLPFACGTVVTVNNAGAGATLDVVAGKATYSAGSGKNNNTTLNLSGVNYSINDTGETITLTAAAIAAGWTGSGTNTVTDTNGGTTSLSVDLLDGVDSFTVNGLADPLTATGGGSAGDNANFAASVTVTGLISATGFDAITQTAGVVLSASTVTLGGNSIGNAGQPIGTKATTVTALGGDGGVFIDEADGANFTLLATGPGAVNVTNATGTLTIAGDSLWGAGDLTLTSGDGIAVDAKLGNALTTGTANIFANNDGIGAQGYIQATTGSLKTSNIVSLNVNTPGGGAGDAVLGTGGGSIITVDANAGSIFWNPGFSIPALNAANTEIFSGVSLTLKTSGTSSAIGNAASPLQVGISGSILANAGDGGVYCTDWAMQDTLVTASTTGPGNVQIWAGNATNNGFKINSVVAESGNISIRSDDSLQLNGLIGGFSFSGTVFLEANRDGANTQIFEQTAPGNIVTSNTTASAVTINVYGVQGTVAKFGNITTGNGGTVTINVAALLGNGTDVDRAGEIAQATGTLFDVGTMGSVVLTAKDNAIGTPTASTQAITVSGGSVKATTNSGATKAGTIIVVANGAVNFQGTTTTSGANIGTIDVFAQGALGLNGDVKTDTGPIGLTSSADITQTAGKVTTLDALNLSYFGTAAFTTAGNSAKSLLLSANQNLKVDGSLTVTDPINIDGALSGSGTVTAGVNIAATGMVLPGTSPGVLGTGSIAFASGSQFVVELNGTTPGAGYDQLKVVGSVDLGGATLAGSLGFTPPSGQKFIIIDNDGGDAVSNTFAGLIEGATVLIGATNFTVSYKGGNGNDVVLTAPGVAAPAAKITTVDINGGAVQRSRVTTLTVNFNQPVTIADINQAFKLNRVSDSASVTLNSVLNGAGTSATITFTGGAVDGAVGNRSLQDGRYVLTAVAAQFTGAGLDGDGNGIGGDDYTSPSAANSPPATPPTGIFRLFGDIDGNGQVNGGDFLQFRLSFLQNNDAFDFDGNGTVDGADFLQFRLRFLQSIV